MNSLSRRRVLGFGSAALLGGGGCLDARAAGPGAVDLVTINHTAARRDVSVRVTEAGGELFRSTVRLRAGDLYDDRGAFDGGRVTVTASLANNPVYEAAATFDLRGCGTPRIVVVVEPGPRLVVERRGEGC